MPNGDILLLGLIVDGHVGRLVDFGRLQYQHLEVEKTEEAGEGWFQKARLRRD